MVRVQDALMQAKEKLATALIVNPMLEARILLAHVIGRDPEYIILAVHNLTIQAHEYQRFIRLVELRTKYIPIAYLVGYKEFYGRNFFVNESVLIPRPDSETLIDAIINDYNDTSIVQQYHNNKIKILDMGVGSGCIIIILLLELRNALGVGVDISIDALDIAYRNCQQYNLTKYITLVQSDWFDKLDHEQSYDIIVCNPPYISVAEIESVAYETLIYEPCDALFSTNNGLDAYHKIAQSVSKFVSVNGRLYIEIGYQQEKQVLEIFQQAGLLLEKKYYDLAGYCRVFKFKLR